MNRYQRDHRPVLTFTSLYCLLLSLLLGFSNLTFGQQVLPPGLSIDQLVEMAQEGLDDEEIIDKIRETNTKFNLTVKQIISLRRKGLSDTVIKELLDQNELTRSDPTRTPLKNLPTPEPTPTVASSNHKQDDLTQYPVAQFDDPYARESTIFKITSTPSKTEVIIDGLSVGVTPYYTNKFFFGKRSLILKKEYYQDLRVEIDLEPEALDDLHLTMKLREPLIKLVWNIGCKSCLKDFHWLVRSCQVQDSETWAPLSIGPIKNDLERLFFVEKSSLSTLKENAEGCLECLVWLKGRMSKAQIRDNRIPQPDLYFLITHLPLTYEKPVDITLELQKNRKYPQGIRIILHGESGQIFRMNTPR